MAVGTRSPVRSVPEGAVAPFLGLPWWAGCGLQSLLSSLCQAAAPTVLAEAWPGRPLQGSQSLLTESWWATVSVGSSKEGICDKACMLLPQRKTALWGPELLSPASCRCSLGFHKDALFRDSVGHVR